MPNNEKIDDIIESVKYYQKRYPKAEVVVEYRKKLHSEQGKFVQSGVRITVDFNHEPHEV